MNILRGQATWGALATFSQGLVNRPDEHDSFKEGLVYADNTSTMAITKIDAGTPVHWVRNDFAFCPGYGESEASRFLWKQISGATIEAIRHHDDTWILEFCGNTTGEQESYYLTNFVVAVDNETLEIEHLENGGSDIYDVVSGALTFSSFTLEEANKVWRFLHTVAAT